MARDLVGVNNDLNMLSGIIDPDNQQYSFEHKININGELKKGVFICRYPSLADRIKMGVIRAKALDGIIEDKVDNTTRNLIYMLATLKVLLIKTPSWFQLEQLQDMDDIVRLYEVVNAWVSRFQQDFLTPRPIANSETATSTENLASSENAENVADRPTNISS